MFTTVPSGMPSQNSYLKVSPLKITYKGMKTPAALTYVTKVTVSALSLDFSFHAHSFLWMPVRSVDVQNHRHYESMQICQTSFSFIWIILIHASCSCQALMVFAKETQDIS
jgi:hypothetical protein